MPLNTNTPEAYLQALPEDRREVVGHIRQELLDHLPEGFEEQMNYGMLGYVVPHHLYPAGYHVDPRLPLPFINLASQKRHIALYHHGLYQNPDLLHWFQAAYAKNARHKLDMGKSCVRFKKLDDIPYKLIGELAEKITPQDWITAYESTIDPR